MVKPENIVAMDGRFVVDIYGNPRNHPIVFLCGWGMSTSIYHDRLVALSENFYVYSVSLPGFGKTMPLSMKETSVAGHARLITEALKDLSLGTKVTLMGHSTGGGVGVLIAEANPELVSEVILITPVGSRDPLIASVKRIIFNSNKSDVDNVVRDEGLLKHWMHNLKLAFNAKSLNLNNEIENVIEKGIPVHMFLSDADVVTPPGKLAEVKGANIYWVEGGHMWMRDNPNDFVNMVNGILSSHIRKVVPQRPSWSNRFKRRVKIFFGKLNPFRGKK